MQEIDGAPFARSKQAAGMVTVANHYAMLEFIGALLPAFSRMFMSIAAQGKPEEKLENVVFDNALTSIPIMVSTTITGIGVDTKRWLLDELLYTYKRVEAARNTPDDTSFLLGSTENVLLAQGIAAAMIRGLTQMLGGKAEARLLTEEELVLAGNTVAEVKRKVDPQADRCTFCSARIGDTRFKLDQFGFCSVVCLETAIVLRESVLRTEEAVVKATMNELGQTIKEEIKAAAAEDAEAAAVADAAIAAAVVSDDSCPPCGAATPTE